MASIEDLLNKKVHLPPIINNTNAPIPKIHIVPPPPEPQTAEEDPTDEMSKSLPYTLSDDLSIFNVIVKYYGDGFHGKIPWSFWQTYKKVTGSTRSNSSLYHHWNGAMRKKYESFIVTGRLKQCIDWLKTAINTQRGPAMMAQEPYHPTGMPLTHIHSTPPVPLMGPPIQFDQPAPLIRTNSTFGQPGYIFFPQAPPPMPPPPM